MKFSKIQKMLPENLDIFTIEMTGFSLLFSPLLGKVGGQGGFCKNFLTIYPTRDSINTL